MLAVSVRQTQRATVKSWHTELVQFQNDKQEGDTRETISGIPSKPYLYGTVTNARTCICWYMVINMAICGQYLVCVHA